MSRSINSGATYRPDIDGLRAIAVIPVLAFHAGLSFLPGGFIGVDIFFVISGYLITGILLSEFGRTGDIKLIDFWARRVRRLAPALLLMLFVLSLSSVFLLERIGGEVGNLAKTTVATALINANHFFLAAGGDYFGASAETNPLLHMWSLSVEEQFYVVWPLVLLFFLKNWGVARTRHLFLVAIVASFGLSCYWTLADTAKAFYLMPSRAWELLAGGWLALFLSKGRWSPGRVNAEIMTVIGFTAIGLSYVLMSAGNGFPGPAAALPVIGTLSLLAAGAAPSRSYVSRMLTWGATVYLGKISYPLYLWHWPILVLMRSQRMYEESIPLDLIGLLIALVLATLTYELVERRSSLRLQNCDARRVVLGGLAGSGTLIVLALVIGAWARFGWGYSAEELRLDASRKDMPPLDCMFSDRFPDGPQFDLCYPRASKPAILLWGDSHANHWRPALTASTEKFGLNLATLTMNACRPLSGPVGRADCVEFNKRVMDSLPDWHSHRGLVGIVMSARFPEGTGTIATSIQDRTSWKPGEFFDSRAHSQREAMAYFEQELRSVFTLAQEEGLRVLLVMPSPVQRYTAGHCLSILSEEKCGVSEQEMQPYVGPAEDVIRRVSAEFAMVRLIEPRKFMCFGGNCPVVINGAIAYTDDDHISKSFSIMKEDEFSAGLAWLLERSK